MVVPGPGAAIHDVRPLVAGGTMADAFPFAVSSRRGDVERTKEMPFARSDVAGVTFQAGSLIHLPVVDPQIQHLAAASGTLARNKLSLG